VANPLLISSISALVLAGAFVPAAAVPGDDGETVLTRLMQQFEDTVNQTLESVQALPLVPVAASGNTEDGRIVSVVLVVRATGGVSLDGLVLLTPTGPVAWSLDEVWRDVDGSLEDGHATRGDLFRLHTALALERGGEAGLSLDVPGFRGVTWELEAPRNLAPQTVELAHRVQY